MRYPTKHPKTPEWVEAKQPPRKGESPWWQDIARDLTKGPLVGTIVSIEELTESLPCYPDGRRPKPRATAKRLRHVLELVTRGPNGSLGSGATYRIVNPVPVPKMTEQAAEHLLVDDDWIQQSIERIVGKK